MAWGFIATGGPAIENDSGAICVRASEAARIGTADAHRGDGKRFVVRMDEKLTEFAELESAIRAGSELS
jgi:hypothetical protein